MIDEHLDQLIDAHLSGVLSAEQRTELEHRLLHSAADRERFWQLAETHTLLHEIVQQGLGGQPPDSRIHKPARWFAWRQLTAAAAGLAIGLFSATVVFAYVVPKTPLIITKALPLADAGFEASTKVPARGIPTEARGWSGDYLHVVEAENGITPKQGQRMLRFLRSDNERSPKDERSYVGEVAQVIDLRPLRAELAGAEQLVELSAQFNSIPTPTTPKYEFAVKTASFRGDIADAPRLWEDREASVSRSDRFVIADSDVATWQRVVVSLMVPPDADFLVIDCAVVFKGRQKDHSATEFPGHYVDQVEVRLSGSSSASTEARHAN